METKTTPLERLKAQQKKLAARIQVIESREKTKNKKKETRRKILVGAYYLDQAQKNNQWEELKTIMANYLKRESDKRLFDIE